MAREGKHQALMEEVSKLTGLYTSEEALRRSREGPHTLPRPVDPTRVAPHRAEVSPAGHHCMHRA